MNGDPYRASQPSDRRVINRSGQAYSRTEEQAQPVKEELPKTIPRSSGAQRPAPQPTTSKKGLFWAVGIIALVLILAVGGWFAWSNANSGNTGINQSRYQAVFLLNGQIYFGKLEDANDRSFRLTHIYYPQAQSDTSKSTDETAAQQTQQNGIQLIKLGKEVHGPEDEMFISKDQVLYYENLTADSKVAQLIEKDAK